MPSVVAGDIDLLDETADHLSSLIGVTVAAPVHLLLLERFHEALRLGIVIRIADPAHARLDVVGGEQRRVRVAGARRDRNDGSGCRAWAGGPQAPWSAPQSPSSPADVCPAPNRLRVG